MITEKEKYERMYNLEEYRVSSPGAAMVKSFMERYLPEPTSVSVYGCGPGRCGLQLFLAGHTVRMIDIAENSIDNRVRDHLDPGRFDFFCQDLSRMQGVPSSEFGFCVDVMEHIPTRLVGDVLDRIRMLTDRLVFFNISGHPDACGKLIGETLHMTVKSGDWWEGALSCYWPSVARVTDGDSTYLFIAEA